MTDQSIVRPHPTGGPPPGGWAPPIWSGPTELVGPHQMGGRQVIILHFPYKNMLKIPSIKITAKTSLLISKIPIYMVLEWYLPDESSARTVPVPCAPNTSVPDACRRPTLGAHENLHSKQYHCATENSSPVSRTIHSLINGTLSWNSVILHYSTWTNILFG